MSNPNTTELLKSLNEHYQNGTFKEATELILKNKDVYAPAVFHEHLGTLYLKMEDYGVARYHLEKAQKSGLVNTNVRHNLKVVKSKVPGADLDKDNGFLSNVVSTGLSMPSGGLLLLTVIALFVTLLMKRFSIIKTYSVAALFLILSFAPFAFEKLYLNKINYAVTLNETPLFEGPSKIYTEVSTLAPGTKFIISKAKNGWYLIEHPEAIVGWVNKKDVGVFE